MQFSPFRTPLLKIYPLSRAIFVPKPLINARCLNSRIISLGTAALIQALVANQISALIVQNLDRLNENVKEESDGIHNTLSIVENLIEFRPEVCKEVADAGLLVWLTKKLKVKMPFDNNKLYASEILSILLQNEPENRKGR